ncbi:MAG TPA: hypothetical protein VF691_00225 [Cytophagaceae bacterium]|jgi:hypothetical protein
MNSQLDISKFKELSETLSKELLDKVINGRRILSGDEIISFSDNPALNYLIIREIFQQWNKETAKLSSPYFDYNHPVVKKAMVDFLNSLSSHISIKIEDFILLLQKATFNYVILTAYPRGILEVLYPEQTTIKLQEIEADRKFIKVNRFLFEELMLSMKRSEKVSMPLPQCQELLENILQNQKDKLETNEELLGRVRAIAKPIDQEETNLKFPQTHIISPEENAEDTHKEAVKQSSVILNDTLAQSSDNTLIDKLSKSRIQSIREEITLIKKFLFLNELFKGNNEDYLKAIDIADNASSYDGAIAKLREEFENKYSWSNESEARLEFLDILRRKYS